MTTTALLLIAFGILIIRLALKLSGKTPFLISGMAQIQSSYGDEDMVCVFPRSADSPIWVPEPLVKHEQKQQTKSKLLDPKISSTASDDSYSLQMPVPAEQQM
ncbi:hypothetical protein P7K49_033936 [Saguinus oedipus]|uniref:Uncharacterized protein n=1 Tax=Saguinus oedipus TaxID=9490 RepID=A0ABQ9TTT4_SAGOE|nr:hypothetical protein P7K49_033936 [Saguinus oedipus]